MNTGEKGSPTGNGWRWAVEAGTSTVWANSMAEAVAGIGLPWVPLPAWPRRWVAFATEEPKQALRARGVEAALPPPPRAGAIPDRLDHADRQWNRRVIEADASGVVNLSATFGQAFDGRTGLLYAEFDLEARTEVAIYSGADYRMEWWIGGIRVFDTLRHGNGSTVLGKAHRFDLALDAGRHLLMVRVLSGSGGWAFASEALRRVAWGDCEPFGLKACRRFDVSDPAEALSWTFDGGDDPGIRLNGQPLPVPLEGMRYREIPGIPSAMLRPGVNTLSRAWNADEVHAVRESLLLKVFGGSAAGPLPAVSGSLRGVLEEQVRLQTEPVLGWASPDSFTLACRTSAVVGLYLEIEGRRWLSPPGLIHRFACDGLRCGTAYEYGIGPVTADGDGAVLFQGRARTLPDVPEHDLVFLGDVYPFDDTWARLSAAVLADPPEAVFFSGDMVLDGREYAQWDDGFFGPARHLLAAVPFYTVIGNHEYDCELFDRIFMNPSPRNWEQRIGAMQIIGIDGARDWSPEGDCHGWLDATLRESAAPFIFVMTHYPPYSSGGHGRVNGAGIPLESTVRQARDFLVPLLTRHRVTAMISGQDHFYERSELPGGLSAIVSGGAGSHLYSKTQNPRQNPHSKVWQSDYHYCRVRVRPETCRLQAVGIDGTMIDETAWAPRR